ncbi:MAG: calcium/sodium antiporter [Patescibacteria group bacterium]|nr:calcium/sodium antiporter [Patescibacteria group bacterium]
MFIDILLFILGFVFLVKGAGVLVDGASAIAKHFGLSSFFIGLTIVAFGTSLPELIVSLMASLQGSTGIAFGNIIGSNISNTILILGVTAMVAPLLVKKATINKELPFSLLAILALGFLVNDIFIDGNGPDALTRIDGLILLLFFAIFIFYTFGISKPKESLVEKTVGDIGNVDDDANMKNTNAIGMIIAGLAGLYLGGRWIVSGGISFAEFFGVSEALIGLTLVAIGTSLPELVTSVVAARKGKTDIAVGNIVGSNVFNLLWVLGLSALFSPIAFDFYLNVDLIILFIATIILIILTYLEKKNILSKKEGTVLVLFYFFYMAFLFYRG